MLECEHGVVACAAHVADVMDAYGAEAELGRLLDSHLHGMGPNVEAEPAIAVENGRGVGLSLDFYLWRRVHFAVAVALHVASEHVGDAMRLDAAQIVCHEHIR